MTNPTHEALSGPAANASVADERRVLASHATRWFGYGKVRTELRWDDESGPMVDQIQVALPGTLAHQLVQTLASGQGVYRCYGCGHGFSPGEDKNRPARGRRAWCGLTPRCDLHAQKRDYANRAYSAERQARRMKAEGRAVSEIAEALDWREATIARWLSKEEAGGK